MQHGKTFSDKEVNLFFPEKRSEPQRDADKRSDAELWASFKQGDESVFVDIYKTYANKLYNYGTKFCSDKELVKDCLQDFFIYLRRNRETLGATTSIKFYLFKSFRRRVIDYIQSRTAEQKKNTMASSFQLKVEVSHEVKYIDVQWHEQQLAKLNNAISRLNEKEREAIFYYFYEGLTYKDIAAIMNFTHIASARRLIYRALASIKEMIITIGPALILSLIL